jgi:hypothetical protein
MNILLKRYAVCGKWHAGMRESRRDDSMVDAWTPPPIPCEREPASGRKINLARNFLGEISVANKLSCLRHLKGLWAQGAGLRAKKTRTDLSGSGM